MRAPHLTRQLVLEERADSPDGAGGRNVAWVPLGVLWAELTPRTGSETVVAGREAPAQGWRIVVRAAPFGAASRPRADQRFREGGRLFNIRTVQEADPAARYLLCLAEEELST